jgi:DNA-binding Lrp family transcriptional regulator
LIRALQGDLPLVPRPFAAIAEEVGFSEAEVLERARRWLKTGVMRRFGATVRHLELGVSANAMSVWRVAAEDVPRAGQIMASFPEVSHCYERSTYEDWPYNLYAMLHGETRTDCERIARAISERTGITDYKMMYTARELKKTSRRYFVVDDPTTEG